ncbi:phenylacetate--CoA ligase family protein [Candidatus Sumerlaeota bacterium]
MNERWWRVIYDHLPVWGQNAAISVYGLGWRRKKQGGVFREALEFLLASEKWSLAELRNYQDERLRELVRHAYETTPYYRELFDSLKLTPGDVRSVDDLPKLPILTRQTLRDRFESMISRGWPKRRVVRGRTGGTTGIPRWLVEDRDTWCWNWAIVWRHRRRFGLSPNDSHVSFGGRVSVVPLGRDDRPFWRRNLASHQIYISSHYLTLANMPKLIDYLQQHPVDYYCGYPSALNLVAQFLLEHDIRLAHPPKAVISNSGILQAWQCAAMRKALSPRVGDLYGQTEHCGIISNCEEDAYHVDMELGVMEFLPLEGIESDARQIICTALHNPVMPLIRYEVGDLATPLEDGGVCACGRASTRVASIDGRVESYVMTPDGRRISRLDYVLTTRGAIRQAQFVQLALDRLTVKIVRGPGYGNADERRLLRDLRLFLGDRIAIEFEYVEEIPCEANGKFRQVISHIVRPGSTRMQADGSGETARASGAGSSHERVSS